MTEQKAKRPPIRESTITRQTRNAFLTALLFIFAIAANLAVSLNHAFAVNTLIAFADSAVLVLFFIVAIIVAIMVRRGQKDTGIHLLLIGFLLTLILRNAFTAGLGVVFGIMALALTSFVALLCLKPSEFNATLLIGLIAGSLILAFDTLAPEYRQVLPADSVMARMSALIATLIALAHIIIVFRQSRQMLLSTKVTLGIVFIVLVSIAILQVVGTRALSTALTRRQNLTLLISSRLAAEEVDDFINRIVEYDLPFEAKTPIFSQYLDEFSGGTPIGMAADTQAKDQLHALQSKNTAILGNNAIKSYALLDTTGKNVLDTLDENIGDDESAADYFLAAYERERGFVSNAEYDPALGATYITFSAPVYTEDGRLVGVLRVRYGTEVLEELLSGYNNPESRVFASIVSKTSTPVFGQMLPELAYIVLEHGYIPELNNKVITQVGTTVITSLQTKRLLPPGATPQRSLDLPELDEALRHIGRVPVFTARSHPTDDPNHIDVVAASALKTEPWIALVVQDKTFFNAPLTEQQDAVMLVAILVAVLAVAGASYGGRLLTEPVRRLTGTANEFAEGKLDARVDIQTEDEIGTLGTAFNSMADQISTLIGSLEERVAARTRDLDRRANLLQAAAEVGSAAASMHDLGELLQQSTFLISERFGFYHAGIFLIDESEEFAVLAAANSDGGRRMLARGHKLKVGEVGIVGYVTGTGEPRIALDVGRDATFFNNPDLPRTRSEMALPLIAGGKILGALDIQSEEGDAFKDEDLATLRVLADQVAISIQNARLFAENQETLDAVHRAYGEQSSSAWKELLRTNRHLAYRGAASGEIGPVQDELDEKLEQVIKTNQLTLDDGGATVNLPINVRGLPIGAIRLRKPQHMGIWSDDELLLAQELVDELGSAVDGARLYQETQQRADRERIVGEITNRMRETMDIDSVIRTAADEIYNVIDLDHVTIQLLSGSDDNADEEAL